MKQRDINVEKRFLSKESRFSAKGQVGLPAGMDDIGRVVDICAAAEVTDTEITDGKLEARGVVRLCITYISRDGAVCGFASETLFSGAVSSAELSADMEKLVSVRCGNISYRVLDSATIEVEIGLVMNAEAACNRAISVADPAEEGIFAKETELELPVLICEKTVKTYPRTTVSADIKGDVISSWGNAVIEKIRPEDGRVAVEGRLWLNAVCPTGDPKRPVMLVSRKAPFGELIEAEGVRENDNIAVTCSVERVGARPAGDGVEIAAVVSVCCRAVRLLRETVATDMYSSRTELKPVVAELPLTQEGGSEVSVRTVTAETKLPEGHAPVEEPLFARGSANIAELRRERGAAEVQGAIDVSLCYMSPEAGIRSAAVSAPFTEKLAMTRGETECTAEVLSVVCTGSGSELTLACEMAFGLSGGEKKLVPVVIDAEEGEARKKQSPGITLVLNGGDRDPFEIGRELGIDPADAQIRDGNMRIIRK